jgi:phosphoglycerate dehydrogenase-like enzyme
VKVIVQTREALIQYLARALPDVEFVYVAPDGEPPPGVEGEVLLTWTSATPNLARVLARGVRWIHTLGTGVDDFPMALLDDRHVLTCSRGASGIPIAEWVLAMMLAFEKRLPETWIHAAPARKWGRGALGGLYGRTLGLVGLGGIGLAVAERALPFGMRVRAFRRHAAASPLGGVEIVASLSELLPTADHVVLAAPATAETRHVLDAAAFAAMKDGVHIVNIARGALVDQDALRRALDAGRVAMASLDAVDPEPLPDGHWLYTHPKVRLSPHVSWSMPGAAELLLDTFVANVRRYRAGAPLDGIIDRSAGY